MIEICSTETEAEFFYLTLCIGESLFDGVMRNLCGTCRPALVCPFEIMWATPSVTFLTWDCTLSEFNWIVVKFIGLLLILNLNVERIC